MFRSNFACPPHGVRKASAIPSAARLSVLGLALLGGGCASNAPAGPSWVNGPIQALLQEDDSQRVAQAQPQQKATSGMRVEIEADGLPAQLAPRNRQPVADDPSEPWSPNYGATVTPLFDQRRLAEKLDTAQPPQPVAALHAPHARPINGDDVIRQAIAAHEMRRRD